MILKLHCLNKRFFLIFLFVSLCCNNIFSQTKNVDSLFFVFRNDILTLQDSENNTLVVDNELKESFYLLLKNSSTDDLLRFIADSNVFVRYYSFNGLIQKQAHKSVIDEAVQILKNDSTKFSIQANSIQSNYQLNYYVNFIISNEETLSIINVDEILKSLEVDKETKLNIHGLRHQYIDLNNMQQLQNLQTYSPNYNVISFSLIINDLEFTSQSSELTKEMKSHILNLKKGEYILLEKIRISTPEGTNRIIPDVLLKIQ